MTPSEGERGSAEGLAKAMNTSPAQTQPDEASGGVLGGAKASSSASARSTAAKIVSAPGAVPAATAAAASSTKHSLARRALDRVPAKWLTTAATVVFLAGTAAFGGLADVQRPEPPRIELGQTYIGSELEMTPIRAMITDTLRDSGTSPGPGERVLTIVMDVQNLSEFPRISAATGALRDVRLEGFDDLSPAITRFDDRTGPPWLQPSVPVRLLLSWVVPAATFPADADVRMLLPNSTRGTGQFVLYGVVWSDAVTGGIMDLPVEDLGTGEAVG